MVAQPSIVRCLPVSGLLFDHQRVLDLGTSFNTLSDWQKAGAEIARFTMLLPMVAKPIHLLQTAALTKSQIAQWIENLPPSDRVTGSSPPQSRQ
jgi:hypothetical protein